MNILVRGMGLGQFRLPGNLGVLYWSSCIAIVHPVPYVANIYSGLFCGERKVVFFQ